MWRFALLVAMTTMLVLSAGAAHGQDVQEQACGEPPTTPATTWLGAVAITGLVGFVGLRRVRRNPQAPLLILGLVLGIGAPATAAEEPEVKCCNLELELIDATINNHNEGSDNNPRWVIHTRPNSSVPDFDTTWNSGVATSTTFTGETSGPKSRHFIDNGDGTFLKHVTLAGSTVTEIDDDGLLDTDPDDFGTPTTGSSVDKVVECPSVSTQTISFEHGPFETFLFTVTYEWTVTE